MIRKTLIALIATAALGVAAIPTVASADWHGHGGGRGGWHGGDHDGWRGGWHGGWGWRGGWYRGWGYPYAYVGSAYYPGCYRAVRVDTAWGPRLRRVWICG